MLYLPSLLTSILVIVSFHWDRLKLSLLRITLHEFIEYRVHSPLVEIIVVTDQPKAMTQMLHSLKFENIEVHAFNSSSSQFTGKDKYDLLWEHREVVKERIHSSRNYSTFIYVEDDTLVPWPSVVSWAIDTEVLEPLGFTRGVFRTEINEAGQQSLLDMTTSIYDGLGCSMNIKDNKSPHYVNTLDLMNYSEESRKLYLQSQEKHRHDYCLPPAHSSTFHRRFTFNQSTLFKHLRVRHSQLAVALCPVHSHFVNLYSPFQGMWIFSRTQLQKIMQDKRWDRWTSYNIDTRRSAGQKSTPWGKAERSNSILYFINPPKGFHTSNVVPFNFLDERTKTRPRLSWYASVEHTRYGYNVHCTVEDALVT